MRQSSSSEHGCFWFLSNDTSETLLPSKKNRVGHQRSLCSALPAHISPTLLSTSPSLGAIAAADYIMVSVLLVDIKHIRKWSKQRRENKECRLRRQGPMPWMTSEFVFAWKIAFYSLCLPLSSSPHPFLACCVESEWCFACLQPGGKTELQSQAAKWWKTLASRDALSLEQELRAKENARFST